MHPPESTLPAEWLAGYPPRVRRRLRKIARRNHPRHGPCRACIIAMAG